MDSTARSMYNTNIYMFAGRMGSGSSATEKFVQCQLSGVVTPVRRQSGLGAPINLIDTGQKPPSASTSLMSLACLRKP